MSAEYSEREQELTCVKCAHPLSDNDLVKKAYRQNTTVGWAKNNLRILADMAEDRELHWFADEARRISEGLRYLDT